MPDILQCPTSSSRLQPTDTQRQWLTSHFSCIAVPVMSYCRRIAVGRSNVVDMCRINTGASCSLQVLVLGTLHNFGVGWGKNVSTIQQKTAAVAVDGSLKRVQRKSKDNYQKHKASIVEVFSHIRQVAPTAQKRAT